MARMKSISTIETELKKAEADLKKAEADLKKAEADLKKAQEKVDFLSDRVLELQKQKQEYETGQIIDAYKKSSKSLEELLTFLDV